MHRSKKNKTYNVSPGICDVTVDRIITNSANPFEFCVPLLFIQPHFSANVVHCNFLQFHQTQLSPVLYQTRLLICDCEHADTCDTCTSHALSKFTAKKRMGDSSLMFYTWKWGVTNTVCNGVKQTKLIQHSSIAKHIWRAAEKQRQLSRRITVMEAITSMAKVLLLHSHSRNFVLTLD